MPPAQRPYGTYRSALLRGEVDDVDMGQAKFADLTTAPRALGTEGLRGCFVVLIATKDAAILAHIAPTSLDGDLKMIRDLYKEKKAAHFQGETKLWVVYPTILGGQPGSSSQSPPDIQVVLDSAKQRILQKLADLGLQPRTASYSFHLYSGGTSPEFEDKGTMRINARSARTEVHLENRALHFFFKRWLGLGVQFLTIIMRIATLPERTFRSSTAFHMTTISTPLYLSKLPSIFPDNYLMTDSYLF